jgi:hypothetical protein
MEKYFDVTYRNEGHWDIYNKDKRLCKIRGEAGNFCVYNDYGNIKNKEGFITVANAMEYICTQLMAE